MRVSRTTVLVLAAVLPPFGQAQEYRLVPKLGGLPHDSGIAGGVECLASRIGGGPADFRVLALGSVKKYEHLELSLGLPRLWKERLFVEAGLRYRNYPEEDFWGLGPDSRKERRSTFRLEDADWTAAIGVRPRKWLRAGISGGLLNVNTGPGQDRDRPSIEEEFAPEEAPGLDRQPDYWHAGSFVEVDYRDKPDDPRSGGSYKFRWNYHHDRDFGRFSFRSFDIDLRQYLSIAKGRDTIAARGLVFLTDTSAGQEIPFFFQPTVGGGGDIRGFHQYRFRDRNRLVFNLEYRWGVSSFIDLVGFGDAGKVFPRPGGFGLNGLEYSAGSGARLKLGGRVFAGADLCVSREGVRFWFRGSHTF